ncbi:5'/3'-nucleotidase SurE [Diaporthe helianthi]|uniref:5'/3'-nucleotidase SurE n=1 Tax=Diaporthe helianthi TaxID=158607 RepID=A0A2P5HUE5_DIAHE|nr:5'/3'-nucleotidase SurE [Diaporthe helianthi]
MGIRSFFTGAAVAALAVTGCQGIRIIQSNDDGWAELYLRSFHDSLLSGGHDAVVSAPAENQSGRSSLDADPARRTAACQYDSCPANTNAATGTNSSDTRLNWVNSFPVTSMRFGINSIGPSRWGGAAPELAVSGPNVGSNVYLQVQFSGTVGAACYAVGEAGLPAIAFSGLTDGNLPWNTVPVPARSLIYADLAANLTNAIIDAGAPYLPPGIFLNVNFPEVTGACTDANNFKWVLSRINPRTIFSAPDVETCGSTALPRDKTVVDAEGCHVSVSVGECRDKSTADAANQKVVLDKLGSFLSCLT